MNHANKTLNVGIAGTGFMGKNHLRHLTSMENVRVVGLYDVSKENGENAADEFAVPYVSDYFRLLQDIDAVVVTVPTHAHFEVVKPAVENDVHVFVEKPFMNTLEEALHIRTLANSHPVKIQIGHVERFNPVFQRLVELVDWNQLVSVAFTRNIPLRKHIDVDVILAVMVHDLDLLIKITNTLDTRIDAVQTVARSGNHPMSPPGKVDSVFSQFSLKDGTLATMAANREGALNERTIQITEAKRTLTADLLNHEIVISKRKNDTGYETDRNVFQAAKGNALFKEMESFVQAVVENKNIVVPVEDGVKVMALIEEIARQAYQD